MAAVLGLDAEKLGAICGEASAAGKVEMANFNCPGQIVISGDAKGVEQASALAKDAGAKRVIPLKVSGPFHTSYMKPAGDALADKFKTITFNEPQFPVLFNAIGGVSWVSLFVLVGYFFGGGRLRDSGNTLVSNTGQYDVKSRDAVFNYHVELTNKKFTLTSDTLYYNTITKVSKIVGPSNIISAGNKIYTEHGYYDTQRDYAQLFDRSVVQNGRSTMTGDSMYYDKKNGRMKAIGNIIYNDKESKNLLTGNYCEYSDTTGYAMATDRAEVRVYSSPDTLYMHADTFKIFSYNQHTDSVYRIIHGYHKARAFRADVQSVCDSLKYDSKDRRMTMYGNPIVWSNNQQLLGEEIQVFLNDSAVDSAHVLRQALLVQALDSSRYNQIASRVMYAYFKDGKIDWSMAKGNVDVAYYPYGSDSVIVGLNRMQTTELRMYMKDKKMSHIWSAPATGTMYPLKMATKSEALLDNFAWFDYIRPKNKDDIFEWKEKTAGTELRETNRRQAPLQKLSDIAREKLRTATKDN